MLKILKLCIFWKFWSFWGQNGRKNQNGPILNCRYIIFADFWLKLSEIVQIVISWSLVQGHLGKPEIPHRTSVKGWGSVGTSWSVQATIYHFIFDLRLNKIFGGISPPSSVSFRKLGRCSPSTVAVDHVLPRRRIVPAKKHRFNRLLDEIML